MKRILTTIAVFFAALGAFAYDADTLALYDFKSGESGASISGTTLSNLVSPGTFDGTPVFGSAGADQATFDEERPGKYVFEVAKRGATPVMTDPMSIRFHGTPKVSFADVGSTLSACDEWTLEFFFRRETTATAGWSNAIQMNCGFVYNPTASAPDTEKEKSGSIQSFIVQMPASAVYAAVRDASYHSCQVAASDAPYSGVINNFKDGYWHHFACTYSASAKKLVMYLDQTEATSACSRETARQVVEESAEMLLGAGFDGHIACLRVSKVVRTPAEFLHASNNPEYLEEKVFHLQLNGTAGDAFTTATNRYVAANPFAGQFIGRAAVTCMATALVKADNPKFSADLPNSPRRRTVMSGDEAVGENVTSGYFDIKQRTTEKYMLPDSGLTLKGSDYWPIDAGSFTLEFFAKVDLTTWRTKTEGTAYPRFALVSFWDGTDGDHADYAIQFSNSGEYWSIAAVAAGSSQKSWGCTDLLTGGGWHHYALVYDDEKLTMEVFIDGTSRLSLPFTKPFRAKALRRSRNFQFGYGANNHPFQGWFDEIRLVRRALDPSEFLTFKNTDGFMLLLR